MIAKHSTSHLGFVNMHTKWKGFKIQSTINLLNEKDIKPLGAIFNKNMTWNQVTENCKKAMNRLTLMKKRNKIPKEN